MVETRVAPRFRVRKPATVERWGSKFACTIRDISITGAAIEFSDLIRSLHIPDKFNLIIPEDGLELSCHVVWRKEYRMGVAFDQD
ncbi:PilZ domain-containing protein [Bradyrhizobium sp. UFLA05-109]